MAHPPFARWLLASAVFLASGCGGHGGEVTGAELVKRRGPPDAFSFECSLRRYDAATATWVQADRAHRFDQWLYATSDGHDQYVLFNGVIVDAARLSTSLEERRNPRMDPRQVGCFEPIATVVDAFDLGEPLVTTVGSAQEASLLTVGDGTRIQGDWYATERTGVLVLSVDGAELIGMVTL